jgi:O-methyltransferase involved in polyketide biosynthesis
MASPTDDEKIGPTAHYTAYVWHRIGMPHAGLFATPLGAALFWAFRLTGEGLAARLPGVPSMTQYLELRHRSFESVLEEEEPDRVIELGAGLSRRGITWAARGLDYVEVDLPAMVRAKERRIAERASRDLRARISGRLTHVAADVLDPSFEDRLRMLLRGASRPVVMAEGLLGYFARADRERLMATVARALPPGGSFVGELRTKPERAAMGAAVGILKGGIRVVTRGRGTREDYEDLDAVRRALGDAGFADAAPLGLERVPHLAWLRTPARVWWARPRA